MRFVVILLLFAFGQMGFGQNLVPNGDFEDYTACPTSPNQVSLLEGWYGRNSPDFLHQCGDPEYGVPHNLVGYQQDEDGLGYVGLYCLVIGWSNYREYIAVELSHHLTAGKRYSLNFAVSLADSSCFAVKNIGGYFTHQSLTVGIDSMLRISPQVKYQGIDHLSSKENWTIINDSFIASGGEKFLTIGNFSDDSSTDTLFTYSDCNMPANANTAYYYIDDVSVTLDTTVGSAEYAANLFSIYPNPTSETLTINSELKENLTYTIYTVRGSQVAHGQMFRNTSVDVSELPSGVYVLKLAGEKSSLRKKFVVQ